MNLISSLFFLLHITQSEIAEEKTVLNENLGFLYEYSTEMFVMDNFIKTYYTRAIPNLCRSEILDGIYSRVSCQDRDGTKRKKMVYDAILKRCDQIWTNEMASLSFLFNHSPNPKPESERRRRSPGNYNTENYTQISRTFNGSRSFVIRR